MKFVIERGEMLRALTLAGRVAQRTTKSTIPILGHALISAGKSTISFTVTDMDRLLCAEVEAVAIGKKGSITANVASMLAFVRATAEGGQVEVELTGEHLVLRAGRARAKLPTLPVADFPVPKPDDATASIDINGDALAAAIGRVSHAQSNEETRYYLNGIFFHIRDGKLRLVATDGHRLAWTDVITEGQVPEDMPGIIVPSKSAGDMQALATDAAENITLEISATRLRIIVAGVEFGTRLVDGTYPDYDRVIPKDNECSFQADRAAFEGAAARCAALGSKESRAIKLTVQKNLVQVASRNPDTGDVEDEIEAQHQGKAAETGFNGAYMAQALAALGSDSLDVEFTPGGPILLRDPADKDGQLQVVMAMRV